MVSRTKTTQPKSQERPTGHQITMWMCISKQASARSSYQPTNASAEMQGDRIAVRFDLPLNELPDLSLGTMILRLYDPTYHYAYTATGLTNPAPDKGEGLCQATLVAFEAEQRQPRYKNSLQRRHARKCPNSRMSGGCRR